MSDLPLRTFVWHNFAMPKDTEKASMEETESPAAEDQQADYPPTEIGGRDGPEPTRFGDWEKDGRCIDF